MGGGLWEEEQSLCHLSQKNKRNKVSFEACSLVGAPGAHKQGESDRAIIRPENWLI